MKVSAYENIRGGGVGVYERPHGLIEVWGKEAVQFLDGMISNDMKTLEDGQQMAAAFPNAQGRLLAIVKIIRQGDRYLIETDEETREKVFQNLFRFTFAGDFFVEDLSEKYRCFETISSHPSTADGVVTKLTDPLWPSFGDVRSRANLYFVPAEDADAFHTSLLTEGVADINDDEYDVLRVESGMPKYGVDMDETTIVPELGIDELISYNKGCYIGQEIIARIYFRGHVAKRLSGLILSGPAEAGSELTSADGKSAGRITSVTFSPGNESNIALGYVRYEFLEHGTQLHSGDLTATVCGLPLLRYSK